MQVGPFHPWTELSRGVGLCVHKGHFSGFVVCGIFPFAVWIQPQGVCFPRHGQSLDAPLWQIQSPNARVRGTDF